LKTWLVGQKLGTQRPPQKVWLKPQPQMPLVHGCPLGHARPHTPQFVTSLERFVQCPLQHASPGAQQCVPQSTGEGGGPGGAPGPHSKKMPVPCAASLLHFPRSGPGWKTELQK
jgi:hypothetical protein